MSVCVCWISVVSISISFVIHEQWQQCDGIYMFSHSDGIWTTIEITNQLRRETTKNERKLQIEGERKVDVLKRKFKRTSF